MRLAGGQKHQNRFFVRFSDYFGGLYAGYPLHINIQKDNGVLIRLILFQKSFSTGKMIHMYFQLIDSSIFLQDLLKPKPVCRRNVNNCYIHCELNKEYLSNKQIPILKFLMIKQLFHSGNDFVGIDFTDFIKSLLNVLIRKKQFQVIAV